MIIVGAGLSGLIAASVFPQAQIVEAGPKTQLKHRALLRFRTSRVGEVTGIEFRKVTVRKGIFYEGSYMEPNILLANMYSQKVVGRIIDRSIWNLEPSERYVAPDDLVQQLGARCNGRITWGTAFDFAKHVAQQRPEPIISTIPLPLTIAATRYDANSADTPVFRRQEIVVKRWRIPNADVFQTVYYPSPRTHLYRASITGSLLIAEYVGEADSMDDEEVFDAFGIAQADADLESETRQQYGKIAPINESYRRAAIHQLTARHSIYSLGRFATWRNILLDDVLHDAFVIKRLMAGDAYSIARKSAP